MFNILLILLRKNWLIKKRNYESTVIQLLCPLFFRFLFFIGGLVNIKPPTIAENRMPPIQSIQKLSSIFERHKYPPFGPYMFGSEPFAVNSSNFYILFGPSSNPIVQNLTKDFTKHYNVNLNKDLVESK